MRQGLSGEHAATPIGAQGEPLPCQAAFETALPDFLRLGLSVSAARRCWRTAVTAAREEMRDAEIGKYVDEALAAAERVHPGSLIGNEARIVDRLDAAIHYLVGWRDVLRARVSSVLAALDQRSCARIFPGRSVEVRDTYTRVLPCCKLPLGECPHVAYETVLAGTTLSIGKADT